jgi:hypothetical protein
MQYYSSVRTHFQFPYIRVAVDRYSHIHRRAADTYENVVVVRARPCEKPDALSRIRLPRHANLVPNHHESTTLISSSPTFSPGCPNFYTLLWTRCSKTQSATLEPSATAANSTLQASTIVSSLRIDTSLGSVTHMRVQRS